MNQIEHVICLTLENRAAFTLWGDYPHVIGSMHDSRVAQHWINRDLSGKKAFHPKKIHDPSFRFSKYLDNSCVKTAEALKNGCGNFVQVLERDLKHVDKKKAPYKEIGSIDIQQPLFYFAKGSLPVLHKLSDEFVICDQYFSSIAGPTWSNRIFALSGQCHDIYETPMDFEQVPFKDLAKQMQTTIFELMEEKGVSYKVYFGDFPLSLLLANNWRPEILENHEPMDNFYLACKEDKLPKFAWIEPRYGTDSNSQHPPFDPLHGEALVAKIYNALRSNEKVWDKCLFIVNWDEHGGLGDCITPPIAWEYRKHYYSSSPHHHHAHHANGECILNDSTDDDKFNSFTLADLCSDFQSIDPDKVVNLAPPEHWLHRFGVRVPNLIISKHVARGHVDSTVMDHTSILKSLCDRFDLDPNRLGPRVPLASTFWHLLAPHATWSHPALQFHRWWAEHREPPFSVPEHDHTILAGQAGKWSEFQEKIFSGISYTLYTLQLFEKVVLLPEHAARYSWDWIMDHFHYLIQRRVKNHRKKKKCQIQENGSKNKRSNAETGHST